MVFGCFWAKTQNESAKNSTVVEFQFSAFADSERLKTQVYVTTHFCRKKAAFFERQKRSFMWPLIFAENELRTVSSVKRNFMWPLQFLRKKRSFFCSPLLHTIFCRKRFAFFMWPRHNGNRIGHRLAFSISGNRAVILEEKVLNDGGLLLCDLQKQIDFFCVPATHVHFPIRLF